MLDAEIWIKTAQLILALSLLIVLHEGGHFLFARLFGIKVEKFFMFFDYKFHLFSTKDKWVERLCPRLYNLETEYGIGWIPLGGYVKIAGMIDESMDTEQLKQPAQPWEFRVKPAWQRLLVMLGGVLVNFVLAIVIYSAISFHWGDDVLPMRDVKQGLWFNQTGLEAGFCQGDLPIAIDGKELEYYNGATRWNLLEAVCNGSTVTVLRDGAEVDVTSPKEFDVLQVSKEQPALMEMLMPAVVDSVIPGSPAWAAGLRPGTRVTAVDGHHMQTWNEYNEIMARRNDILASGCSREDSIRLRTVTISYIGAGCDKSRTYSVRLTRDYRFGFFMAMPDYETQHISYGLLESIPVGWERGINTLVTQVTSFKYVFSAEGAKNIGSFITIGNLFAPVWDWFSFWSMTALLSIILFFMNLLPIPALDGGHALFCIIEMLTGKVPSDKFMERMQWVGMTLLMMLMALAIFNDFARYVFHFLT